MFIDSLDWSKHFYSLDFYWKIFYKEKEKTFVMSGHILITIAVAIFAIIVPSVSGNACADIKGTGKTFIPNPTLCSAYIICENSKVVNGGSCGTSSIFNGTSCQTKPEDYECPPSPLANICLGKDDKTTVASPDNCKDYYYCLDDAGFIGTCVTGKIYDATINKCVTSPSNECPTETGSANLCEGQAPGKFIPSLTNCYEYYYCDDTGAAVAGVCPSDLSFNPKLGSCVFSDTYSCPITGGERPTPPPDPKVVCKDAISTKTYVKDALSCTGYYNCADGKDTAKPVKLECLDNKQFSEEKGTCVAPEEANCSVPPCVGQPKDKFVKDPENCHDYYYCKGDNTGTKASCAADYEFDGSVGKCKPPSASCPPSP